MKKLLCLLAPLLLLSGCAPAPISKTGFALDTVVSVTLYQGGDEETAQEALALCRDYEAIFSPTAPNSELYQVNQGEITRLSGDLAAVLKEALEFAALSGGAFDPTVGALTSLWDFSAQDPSPPDRAAIQSALDHVGYDKVTLAGDGTITISDPQLRIDLGAIAKGYIADRVRDFLLEEGVTSAIINLGGNLYCIGGRPDGSPFEIAIQTPFGSSDDTAVTLAVEDLSVVTSGVYQRYFQEDGVLYHHILDPRTGYPADTGLLSVTILAPRSVDADALSTTCFLLGLDDGLALVDSLDGVGAVFITEDMVLHYSQNFPWEILS